MIWSRAGRHVAIEVKASARWRSAEGRALKEFSDRIENVRPLAVYLGDRPLKDEGLDIFPLADFLRRLNAGKIIGGPG